MERVRDIGESLNETLVDVTSTKERSQLGQVSKERRFLDSLCRFFRNGQLSREDDVTEVIDLALEELAFAELERYPCVAQDP